MNDRFEQIRRWLRLAQEDLREAGRVLAAQEAVPRFACFHAHESVEKALKAALVFTGILPGRSHDLDGLTSRLPDGWHVKTYKGQLGTLTEWAERSLYPGDWPDATERDALEAVRQARAVWESVTADLASRGFDVATELP